MSHKITDNQEFKYTAHTKPLIISWGLLRIIIIFNYMPTGSLSGTSETNFSFSCPVQAKQYYTNSDMRFKTDISLIEGYSEGLSNLTPVSYYLNMPLKEMADSISILSSEVTEKSTNPQIGFLAQEVRSIYPELVCEDEDGNLAVDYQGFIPLLVEAVSSLKKTVSKQEKIIEQLLGLIEGVQLFDESDSDSQDAYLGQNRPNPAKGECLIEYIIPENVTTAIIELASTDGLTQHSYNIGERGKGTLKIDASYLNPGVYVYTLIVDGMEAGSHRMIVSY